MADGQKSALMKILIIAGVVLVVDVMAGFLIMKFVLPTFYKTEENSAKGEKKKKEGKEDKAPALERVLESMNLNPAGSSGEILSTEIVLETHNPAVIEELTACDSRVRDILLTYLSFKTVGELSDISKRDIYKKEMIGKINGILKSGKITGLYTKSWIIQFE